MGYIGYRQESSASVITPPIGATYTFIDIADGKLKRKNDDGSITDIEASAAGVNSFNGRAGTVVPQNGDYSAAQITNFDTAADARITVQKGAINGLATLDASGLIPESQLPAIAKVVPYEVANTAAMLALPAQPGDVATITGSPGETYMLAALPATLLSNWIKFRVAVNTVNGYTGTVALTYSDVGATPSSHVGSGGAQHAQVTTSVDGFMSASDKTKLDGIEPLANEGITDLTGDVVAVGPGSVPVTLSDTVINGKLLTGYASTLGVVSASDSILAGFGKLGLTQSLAPRTVSQSITVPDGYVWLRPSMRLTGSIRLLGDSELKLI